MQSTQGGVGVNQNMGTHRTQDVNKEGQVIQLVVIRGILYHKEDICFADTDLVQVLAHTDIQIQISACRKL